MRNLKRALSLTMTAAMISSLVVTAGAVSYPDVATDKHNVEAIEVLKAVNIMEGDTDGKFNPEKVVTRNEIAVIMSKLMAYNVASYAGTSPFTDVPTWAEPFVAACYTNGITAGISDTTYGGDQEVTTAQAALMVMKALGYFQFQSDFGADWQLATVAQGNKIDLFNGVASGVKEGMPRNDVAQLVLNALESGTVEADDNTIVIETGDTTVSAGKVKYNYVTSTQDYAKAIDSVESTTDYTDANAYIVELGEKLYQGNLKKSSTVTSTGAHTALSDAFGRPATRWEYQSKEVGVFAEDADYSFTGKVTPKSLYDTVGKTAVEEYKWYVSVDGYSAISGANFAALKNERTNGVDELVEETLQAELLGSGSPWNGNAWDDVKSNLKTGNGVRTEVFVDAVNGYVHLSVTHYHAAEVYTVDTEEGLTTLSDLGNGPALRSDLFETTDFTEDQIVTYAYSYDTSKIEEIHSATRMEGTVTATRVNNSDEQDGDYYTVDGTQYKYNQTVPSDARLVTENVNNDVVAYMDQYGYAIYIDEAAINYDYAYVLTMGNDGDQYDNNNTYLTYYARLVLADGSVVKVETDARNMDLRGNIVSYTVDKNGIYTLSARDGLGKGTKGTTDLAPAVDEDALKIENGVAHFTAPGGDGSGYTANSNTVFIVAESDNQDPDEFDFTVYTGVKNVPDIKGSSDAYVAVAADSTGIAKVVYIQNGDVSGAGEVYFAVANTGAKLVRDSELGDYREITAAVDGEIVTLKVKVDSSAEEKLTSAVAGSAFDANYEGVVVASKDTNGDGVVDTATKRIVALEGITTNADGLVTNVRLYEKRNTDGDGSKAFGEGTDRATKETVELGGTDGSGSRYAWYDDVAVVRYDDKSGDLYISDMGSVKQDTDDLSLGMFAGGVLSGLCIVEYKDAASVDSQSTVKRLAAAVKGENFPRNLTIESAAENDLDSSKVDITIVDNTAFRAATLTLKEDKTYAVVVDGKAYSAICKVVNKKNTLTITVPKAEDGVLTVESVALTTPLADDTIMVEGLLPEDKSVTVAVTNVDLGNASVGDEVTVTFTQPVSKARSITKLVKGNEYIITINNTAVSGVCEESGASLVVKFVYELKESDLGADAKLVISDVADNGVYKISKDAKITVVNK